MYEENFKIKNYPFLLDHPIGLIIQSRVKKVKATSVTCIYFLSYRGEPSKNKLSAYLLVDPHFTDWLENNPREKRTSFPQNLIEGDGGREIRIRR
jgi:hypothetical protein